ARSTWTYRDRAYGDHFWDNGMILANALAMGAAHNLPAAVLMGFVESEVNKLIGIDGQQELALGLLAVGHSDSSFEDNATIESLAEIKFDVLPISDSPVDYPSIREMHAASSFTVGDDARDWRSVVRRSNPPVIEGEPFPLAKISDEETGGGGVGDGRYRRS